MKENYTICHCMGVTYNDVATALETHSKMEDVVDAFKDVQRATNCSTGCGGCYHSVLDAISEILMTH